MSCVTNLSGYESLRDDLDLAVIVSRGQMDDSDYIARHLVTILAPSLRPLRHPALWHAFSNTAI